MRFEDFKIGQTFETHITISNEESMMYMSFTKTKNILLENSEMAKKEGVKQQFLSGRSILSRAEGEMTRQEIFSDSIMMLYGMDGDPSWKCRQTRFLKEVHPGEELLVKYIVSEKTDTPNSPYGILSIDFEIYKEKEQQLVIISRRNLYRIKK